MNKRASLILLVILSSFANGCGSGPIGAILPLDSDGDGLTDDFESELGTASGLSDSDGDGLSDGDEVNQFLSDPMRSDTDSDGLTDAQELQTYGTNPLLADTDGDGLMDGIETSPSVGSNPKNPDTDSDGIMDGDEIRAGLNVNLRNPTGIVLEAYCGEYVLVSTPIGNAVYSTNSVFFGNFILGLFPGDLVAFSLNPVLPGDQLTPIYLNLTSHESGFAAWEGHRVHGGGYITGASPTTYSIRVNTSSGYSFEINLFDLDETYDWYIGDRVEIVLRPILGDPNPLMQMLNVTRCEAVLVN